jgi:hypothetical protein
MRGSLYPLNAPIARSKKTEPAERLDADETVEFNGVVCSSASKEKSAEPALANLAEFFFATFRN